MKILSESEWRARRAAHEGRVRPWLEPRLTRMARGERHPVEDFLFEYYSYRPAHLLRWHPGLEVTLENGGEFLGGKGYRKVDGPDSSPRVAIDPGRLTEERRRSLGWVRDLLERTASRPPALGCFGLHEWAMVYRAETIRHTQWPLRLAPDEIAAVVEAAGIRCTHFDAFRFFTPSARPLNRLQPTRETVAEFEQPGCLHANMDLYKWAMKLQPFSASELVADCFALAREIRCLDMRASPYDFSAMDLKPVCIETPAGRAAYESAQREFALRAAPLRQRVIACCEALLEAANGAERVAA